MIEYPIFVRWNKQTQKDNNMEISTDGNYFYKLKLEMGLSLLLKKS
jgi:hypothetical protein